MNGLKRPLAPAPGQSLLVLLAVAAGIAGALVSLLPDRRRDTELTIEAIPVPLSAAEPWRDRLGPLTYLGGLWLRSTDSRFGGLSDLRVSRDGARAFAVSDCGYGFTASLSYDTAGRLSGLVHPSLVVLTDSNGLPLGRSRADAESLVLGDGLEVGFEGARRVRQYGIEPPFLGPSRTLGVPRGLSTCERGASLEAMTDTGDGRRLLVCEGRLRASENVPAWIGRGETWQPREFPLAFDGGWGGQPFRPTGAALLPDGDLLVLERRFPPAAARLVRIPRAQLEGTGSFAPREIARIEAPLAVDNFEGVEARRDAAGRTLVYLLSDDNGCAKAGHAGAHSMIARHLQRTLLLLFALDSRAAQQ